MFSVDLDLSDCQRACRAASVEAGLGIRLAVTHGAEEAIAEAKASPPYKDRTGELTRSAYARPVSTGLLNATAVMGWTAKHASYIDAGTPAHDIRPKLAEAFHGPAREGQSRRGKREFVVGRGIALRWKGPGGESIFARVVHHPGTRATGLAGRAIHKAERVAIREIEVMRDRIEHAFNN
jgi:hypothetical protein